MFFASAVDPLLLRYMRTVRKSLTDHYFYMLVLLYSDIFWMFLNLARDNNNPKVLFVVFYGEFVDIF